MYKHKILSLSAAVFSLLIILSFDTPVHAQAALYQTKVLSAAQAYRRGDYPEAFRLGKEAKAIADQTHMTGQSLAMSVDTLAECQRAMGYYKESETTFQEGLALTEKTKPAWRNAVLPEVLNAYAMLKESTGNYAEAEALWLQCEAMGGKNMNFAYFPANHLTNLYIRWGKGGQAETYIKESERCAKKAPKQLAVGYYLYSLGQYQVFKGDYKSAEKSYDKSIDFIRRTLSTDHPYVAEAEIAQGDLYRKESRFADAEKTLREAKKIYDMRSFSKDHPDVCRVTVQLANVLSDQGRYGEARELVDSALKSEQALYGTSDNPFIGEALYCQGNIARQEARYQEAKDLLTKSLDMRTHLLGDQHIDVAVTKRALAMVDIETGDFKEAETLLKDSLQSIETHTGSEHPERVVAASALANFYLRDQKYDQAETLFLQALSSAEQRLGANHVVLANIHRDLGELYQTRKDYAKAAESLTKVVKIDEVLFGDKSPQVAADLMTLATIYGAEGKAAEADPILKRVALIKNVLPGGNVVTESPVAFSNANDKPIRDKWALVVGVSSFKDSSINLKYAAKDATDFKTFLVNTEKFKPDHVKLITDGDATRDNIIGLLGDKWLARRAQPDDLVVVYVSSHGSRSQDDVSGVNFLVAYDTNKNSLAATGIPMQWLTKIVKDQVHSNRVLLILDVCHSGAVTPGAKALNRTIGFDPKILNIGSGQMVLCSSSADQSSWESKSYENSVFTRKLMDALQCNKDKTTVIDAYNRLKVSVESEVLRDRGELQTPILFNKTWTGKDPILAAEPVIH